jgi:hypothetical protein
MKYYCGIGARDTPEEICELFVKIGEWLSKKGYILRSGGANGADSAFAKNVDDDKKEIFLPWRGFNNNGSPLFNIPESAFIMAEKYHPAWHKLSDAAKLLISRNCMQIFGRNMDEKERVEFVVCYTKNGEVIGGSGQALRICLDYNIPIFNFGSDGRERLREYFS